MNVSALVGARGISVTKMNIGFKFVGDASTISDCGKAVSTHLVHSLVHLLHCLRASTVAHNRLATRCASYAVVEEFKSPFLNALYLDAVLSVVFAPSVLTPRIHKRAHNVKLIVRQPLGRTNESTG